MIIFALSDNVGPIFDALSENEIWKYHTYGKLRIPLNQMSLFTILLQCPKSSSGPFTCSSRYCAYDRH